MRNLESFVGEEFANFTTSLGHAEGIKVTERIKNGISRMEVTLAPENALGKKEGNYFTLDLPDFSLKSKKKMILELSKVIKRLLPLNLSSVLVLGMGNAEIVSDSLGPKTVSRIDVLEVIRNRENLRIAKFCPGVVAVSGIESFDLSRAVADVFQPDAIIVVDSLCTKNADRLGSSFQVTDTGIVPGSAVGDSVCELSSATLKARVISIGVPVVIYLKSAIRDAIQKIGPSNADLRVLFNKMEAMDGIFSPKEIDFLVNFSSEVVSRAIFEAILH